MMDVVCAKKISSVLIVLTVTIQNIEVKIKRCLLLS